MRSKLFKDFNLGKQDTDFALSYNSIKEKKEVDETVE